jgi:hypothetical protein
LDPDDVFAYSWRGLEFIGPFPRYRILPPIKFHSKKHVISHDGVPPRRVRHKPLRARTAPGINFPVNLLVPNRYDSAKLFKLPLSIAFRSLFVHALERDPNRTLV